MPKVKIHLPVLRDNQWMNNSHPLPFNAIDNPPQEPEEREPVSATLHVRPRGRPPKPVEAYCRELRLTPIDDQPIKWFTQDGIVKIVAFEEGGPGTTKKLHYHALVETTLSHDLLVKYCYALTRGKGTEGNKAFMSRETHDNTKGYIAKHKQLAYNVGYDEKDLQDWYAKSDEYVSNLKRETEKYRKIKALGRRKELLSVEQDIANELESMPERPYCIATYAIKRFIDLCKERNFDFPTKSQMDSIVNRLRYPYTPDMVYAFYYRGLNILDEYTRNAYRS